MTSPYSLGTNVFYCELDAAVIFLDVGADTYSRLTPDQAAWFREIRSAEDPARLDRNARRFVRHLLTKGLLIPAVSTGGPLEGTQRQQARSSLMDTMLADPPSASPGQCVQFAYAVLAAGFLERTGSFARVLSRARRWKRTTRKQGPVPDARVHLLTRIFDNLSPYMLTRHDACRFRSLALLRFLSLSGVSADWVFGVRLSPFGAHCWVEYGDLILNDHADNTAEYKPIMIV